MSEPLTVLTVTQIRALCSAKGLAVGPELARQMNRAMIPTTVKIDEVRVKYILGFGHEAPGLVMTRAPLLRSLMGVPGDVKIRAFVSSSVLTILADARA